MRPLCSFAGFPDEVIATAIHAGHELRPEVLARTALDDATRLREEDPFTDLLTAIGGATVVAHRSRFVEFMIFQYDASRTVRWEDDFFCAA